MPELKINFKKNFGRRWGSGFNKLRKYKNSIETNHGAGHCINSTYRAKSGHKRKNPYLFEIIIVASYAEMIRFYTCITLRITASATKRFLI